MLLYVTFFQNAQVLVKGGGHGTGLKHKSAKSATFLNIAHSISLVSSPGVYLYAIDGSCSHTIDSAEAAPSSRFIVATAGGAMPSVSQTDAEPKIAWHPRYSVTVFRWLQI